MATVRLYDHNIAGFIEFNTDDSPEEVHEFIESVAGAWCIDFPGGAVLLTDEWHADYFIGTPDEFDPYPDYRLTGSERPEFAELGGVTPA